MLEFQEYQITEKVHATKVIRIEVLADGNARITPSTGDSFVVSTEFMTRQSPRANGYIVRGAPGNEWIFIPSEIFEAIYKQVSEEDK